MSFSEQKKRFGDIAIRPALSEVYLEEYFSSDHNRRLKELDERYFSHLYGDLMNKETQKDFEMFLGSEYRYTNNCAKECVEQAFVAMEIIEYRLKAWTDSALKCFDNFLLVYIQDHLEERISSYLKMGEERYKYEHLVKKGEGHATIGTCFHTIYSQRNEMTHVEVMEKDGRRMQKKLSRKKLKKLKAIILENFERALTILEQKLPENGIQRTK